MAPVVTGRYPNTTQKRSETTQALSHFISLFFVNPCGPDSTTEPRVIFLSFFYFRSRFTWILTPAILGFFLYTSLIPLPPRLNQDPLLPFVSPAARLGGGSSHSFSPSLRPPTHSPDRSITSQSFLPAPISQTTLLPNRAKGHRDFTSRLIQLQPLFFFSFHESALPGAGSGPLQSCQAPIASRSLRGSARKIKSRSSLAASRSSDSMATIRAR